MTKAIAVITLALLFAAVSLEAAEEKNLYERLGGKPAIEAVVDKFIDNVVKDKAINKFFANTVKDKNKATTFRNHLVDQICEAAGGPCEYTGKDMKEAHAGMGIQKKHFKALVGDLKKALAHFKVPAKEQKELLGLLAPMEGAIVEKPGKKMKKQQG